MHEDSRLKKAKGLVWTLQVAEQASTSREQNKERLMEVIGGRKFISETEVCPAPS